MFVTDPVQLDGMGSSDVDGDVLLYDWTLLSVPPGSTATLDDPISETPSFEADKAGTYVGQLIVNDGTADSVAVLSGGTLCSVQSYRSASPSTSLEPLPSSWTGSVTNTSWSGPALTTGLEFWVEMVTGSGSLSSLPVELDECAKQQQCQPG